MFKRVIQQKSSAGAAEASSSPKSGLLVDLRLTVHHGIPASASVLAYEPGQRLLAIASRDGRIKIFGRDGVEVLFKSPSNAPCKYLEFVNNEGRLIHVTTRNEIEVWDLGTKELVSSKTWEADITAFAVIQATAFMYVGDETGQISVLQFNGEDRSLLQMQYSIPAHLTLSGLVDAVDESAPSVVSILPQPDAVHSRIGIVYGNGIIVLWGLHEAQVLAVRGGTEDQQRRLVGKTSAEADEEKEPCCSCWVCPSGTLLAVGYTDGDIWVWNMSVNPKAKSEKPDCSGSPALKIILSSEEMRMPVVVMKYSASAKSDKGPGGHLFVFGGQDMGMPEVVTVLPLADPAAQMQLLLRGPFADVIVLSNGPAIGNGILLILSSPGSLDVYEEINLYDSLKAEKAPAAPVSARLQLALSSITSSKLLVVPEQSIVAANILKIPRVLKGYVPPALPSGTRWPVSGGNFSSITVERRSQPCIFVTGHENGLLNVWDASIPCLYFLTTVNNRGLVGSELSAISAIDFCVTVGLLAAGDESGLVFVYTMQGESGDGTCHFISRDEPPTKRDIQHSAGFQCFAVLNLHSSPIRSLTIRSDCRCLAIGDDDGLVTLFDVESCAVRFHGKCGSAAGVVSSSFIDLPSRESNSRNQQDTIVLVLFKDGCITAIDGNTGKTIGSGRPKNPCTAVSLHVLDPSGASVKSVFRAPSRKVSKRSVIMAVIETDSSGSHIEPVESNEEIEEELKQEDDWTGSHTLVLLCSEDALRMYSISSVLQGMRTSIRKITLEKTCCSAWTFDSGTHGSGILILYNTGDIEIRSLPDLEIIKITSVSETLHWEFGKSSSFFNTFSAASNGRLTAVDADQEVLFMSVLADENDMRVPGSYPILFDKDVAAATEAAIKASTQSAKKKQQSQIQDLFGGVMKELKHSLGNAMSGGDRTASELPKLFSKPVSPGSSHGTSIVKRLKAVANPESSTSSDRHSDRSSERQQSTERSPEAGSDSPDKEQDLDIDDIDLDDDDDLKSPSPSPSEGPAKKGGVMRKLRSSFNKGKKRASSIKVDHDEERNMLFEGGSSAEPKSSEKMPAVRTAEEIRAAYGHKRSGEASAAISHARDRLMERQERLQNIGRRTEEMQDNAENFASMAEELAKKMESRKWWEI